MSSAVLSVYKVANFPGGGGHFWVYMQYAQGLRRLGCDVYWLEQLRAAATAEEEARLAATHFARLRDFGLDGKVVLYTADRTASSGVRFIGCTEAQARALLGRVDVLFNFHYAIRPEILSWARRTALVDIDPGLLQFWMSTGQLDVAAHDRYLSTGETVGTPRARFSDCGLHWTRIRPPICLELWPAVNEPAARTFTTVSGWNSASWLKMTENGRTTLTDNTKRVSFLEYLDLPLRSGRQLELALFLLDRDPAAKRVKQVQEDARDRALLEENGWIVQDSRLVAGSPGDYREYVQRSRGEFSCAKPSCMAFQNAWVSDRSLCYMASGKPVIVQHTGPSSYLPNGEGMFRFSSVDEAVHALRAVDADYRRHCRAAREIAESYFDSHQVLTMALNAALGPARAMEPADLPAAGAVT
jgi:hypothetical protein